MPEDDDEARREDLAATSDSLREDAQRVVEIEDTKQGLEADDPRVISLSNEAERLADSVQRKSRIERDLAGSIAGDAEPPKPSH